MQLFKPNHRIMRSCTLETLPKLYPG